MSEARFKIGDKIRLTEEWKKHVVSFPDKVVCMAFTVVDIYKKEGIFFYGCKCDKCDSYGFEVPEEAIGLYSNTSVGKTSCNDENKEAMFINLTQQMLETFKKKNADYGDSTTKTFKKFGLIAYAVRLDDKLSRIKSFCQKGAFEVKDESIVDTLLDAANYCLLAVIDIKNQKRYEKSNVRDGE